MADAGHYCERRLRQQRQDRLEEGGFVLDLIAVSDNDAYRHGHP